MVTTEINKDQIWDFLKEIPDPEVPAINIVELGVVRDVLISDDKIQITITPTYSGCPAMKVMEEDILSTLKEKGFQNITIKTVFSPAWTTDWMTEETKLKLKTYGIAPPEKLSAEQIFPFLSDKKKTIACPFCNSENTVLRSQFGSTACKALYYCNGCEQPFEYFKCH
jgi:ring-1,2-phenylacetyl-CoA epoxidase subunit PaaD